MNVNIPETYYSHTVGITPPAYRLFSDWTVTAALIFESLSKYGSVPDDIRWETGQPQVSEFNVTCMLRGALSGHVKFSPLSVQLFISASDTRTPDVPAPLEDALTVLRRLDSRHVVSSHRVAIGAHVDLIDDTFVAFMSRHMNLTSSAATFRPQSFVLDFDLPNDKKGTIDLQPSLKFTESTFFFGIVTCNWSGELDVRKAYEQSLEVTIERAKALGLDIAAEK